MSQNGYRPTDLTSDDLTTGAIETLYEIVSLAQNSTDNPSRALFNAYNNVLESKHQLPSDDAVLHRFLSHMQEHGREGEDLFYRFQRVMKEFFGFDIERGTEEIQVASNVDQTRNQAQPTLGRTGSFDSFLDGTADKVAGVEYGDLAVRPRRASQQGVPDGYGDKARQRRSRSDTEAHSSQPAQLPVRAKVNGNVPRRSTSAHQPPAHKRSVSVSSRGSLQIRRGGPVETRKIENHDADESDLTDRTASFDISSIQIPGVNAPIPDDRYESPRQQQPFAPEPFRLSDTRLMDDAETFEEQRIHRVTRECIRIWRDRTQARLNMRNDMERAAIAFDRHVLLRASIVQLRDTALMRRSARETNRFFDRLETRADKARSLFLLTKAFTHWAKCAEDEVQRTSVARRHILRTRFFNGWRDITAVNELKIQHFALAKFLSRWRSRTAEVRDRDQFAGEYYEDKLVNRSWKALNDAYLERGASNWHDKRVVRTSLQKWHTTTETLRERDVWASDRWDATVLRKTFQTWRQRTAAVQTMQSQANGFQQNSVLRTAFHVIQKQARLEPLLRQYRAGTDRRVLTTAFQDWCTDAQLSRQARNVDRMRVLRNAYTAWNDRLRIKALQDRINDRLIVESLYKWTLASRVSLFQRVHNRQLKESVFLTWITRTNQRANTLDAAERRFAQFKRNQLLRTCLRKMEAITTEKRAEEFAIVAEYQQKLKQRIFDKLKERQQHFQQLSKWSADARFYVLGKHTLKTWSEATQHARRNRRRDAYSQVRRTVKTNLVRKAFEYWRSNANHVVALTQRANDMRDNRTLQNSAAIVHQWHDRTLVLRQQDAQAANLHAFKVSTRYLTHWSERMNTLQTMDAQAVALRQESTELAATGALKKMGWRLWNIHRQEDNARALFDRNFEKHVRAMVRFWLEKANERLAERSASPTPRRRRRRDDDHGNDNDGGNRAGLDDHLDNDKGEQGGLDQPNEETQRLEGWSAFDETALGLNNDLDLSLSITPEQPKRYPSFTPNVYSRPPLSSSARPPGSILRRSTTFGQSQSTFRPQPATIAEDEESDIDFFDAAQSTFWTGTPMPPPPTSKPGYLKTPSKRSVARAKHPELPPSPEKQLRVQSPVRRPLPLRLERERAGLTLGSMSAPPVRSTLDPSLGAAPIGGVTSFERRLREGGFGGSVAATGGAGRLGGRGGGRFGGKGRVGFGDVSHMG
ncbi:Sfi1-domain-containing protein [Pyrenophora teres f. teres]|uniref:Sfi1-domain-containing protein n=1 Tax=Pyrenophora teres f. teres TaxID=97479 RepID=A0A6S6VW75_9PLEO|nr:Sfi1-domain-containing protein [Pyrenophora teres f. teres]